MANLGRFIDQEHRFHNNDSSIVFRGLGKRVAARAKRDSSAARERKESRRDINKEPRGYTSEEKRKWKWKRR